MSWLPKRKIFKIETLHQRRVILTQKNPKDPLKTSEFRIFSKDFAPALENCSCLPSRSRQFLSWNENLQAGISAIIKEQYLNHINKMIGIKYSTSTHLLPKLLCCSFMPAQPASRKIQKLFWSSGSVFALFASVFFCFSRCIFSLHADGGFLVS